MRGSQVCLVTARTTGGIGRHVASLVPELVGRGAQVTVVGPHDTRRFGAEGAGARFVGLSIPSPLIALAHPGVRRRLRRAFRGQDLVHAHGVRAALVSGRIARAFEPMAVVATIHNSTLRSDFLSRSLESAAHREISARSNVVVCVSSDLASKVRAEGAGDVRVIPARARLEDVPGDEALRARRGLELPGAGPLVVAVGRLHVQKGFDVLIESMSLLPREIALVIAGEGPQRKKLEEMTRRLGLSDRVRLLGDRPDAPALMAAADLVVMPSRWEGSPLSLQEAMSAGSPIVATEVGGIPDMVQNGVDGILIRPEDPQALAQAILRATTDPAAAAKLGSAARLAASKWPDASETAREIADLYESLLQRNPGRSS